MFRRPAGNYAMQTLLFHNSFNWKELNMKKKSSSFTLIELLVVIAIIGIFAPFKYHNSTLNILMTYNKNIEFLRGEL